jgi:response regulator NasT
MTQPLRIAVADDEQDMRDFFERMLRAAGHQVVSIAENGRELVEHCRATRPDLVITDVMMPEMDGIQAAIEISRERPVAIILVSAYHDAKIVERAADAHIMAYLVKPIGKAQLAPAITVAMQRFEQFQKVSKEASDLRQALADRKLIEQAKGILMKVTGADEKDAFRRLQELAAEKNQKLVDAAQAVISLEKTLRPVPP